MLSQELNGLKQNIENLLSEDNNAHPPIAYKGNPNATRMLGNYFKPYFNEGINAFGQVMDVPKELAAAIAFGNMPSINQLDNFWKREEFGHSLNSESVFPNPSPYIFNERNPLSIGVCSVRPHILAMFLPKNDFIDINNFNADNSPIYTPRYLNTYTVLTGTIKEKSIFDSFNGLALADRIDIYNLLRFPKSNIKMCLFLLNQLKKTKDDWQAIGAASFITNNKVVAGLCTAFFNGPRDEYKKTTKKANTTYSYFMQRVFSDNITASPIEFKIIKIKVLDVRSGRPITFAKMKSLVISAGDNHKIGHDKFKVENDEVIKDGTDFPKFSYEESQNNPSYTLAKRAQIALNELGYNNGNPGNSFGPDARLQYNKYWENRLANPAIVSPATGDPIDIYLIYIEAEYLSHRETDEFGELKIRVPKSFFIAGKPLKIEIGFWEFPILVERLKFETDTIKRSEINPNTITNTNFTVSWIDSTQEQEKDWNPEEYDNTKDYFRWEVKNGTNGSRKLRVNEVIKIKDAAGTEIQSNLLSSFYDLIAHPFHFVLFGMQWCQPVWAPIPNTATHWIKGNVSPINGHPSGISEKIPDNQRNMPVLVTQHKGGGTGKGRDYGSLVLKSDYAYQFDGQQFSSNNYPALFQTYVDNNRPTPRQDEDGGNKQHQGIDYLSNDDSSTISNSNNSSLLFAFHGGVIKNENEGGFGLQYSVQIINRIITDKIYKAFYAHMETKVSNLHNTGVLAGQKIGTIGRSNGEGDYSSNYIDGPTHLHFEIRYNILIGNQYARLTKPKDIFQLTAEDINSPNQNLILDFDGYRLFPCDCKNGNLAAFRCVIRSNDLPNANLNKCSECWASRNLHCPYMAGDAKKVFRIQAQLNYFKDDRPDNDDFKYPGSIDGNWGTKPTNKNVTGLTDAVNISLVPGSLIDDELVNIKFRENNDAIKPEQNGWIIPHLLKEAGSYYKLIISELGSLLTNDTIKTQKTRMAIYYFKKAHSLLSDGEDYAANFDTDDTFEDKLNENDKARYPRINLNRVDK
ncbi:MAG: peptidoglycan DD-metalloendopeptidase family protein [Saprospiraceae bacterium]|nr:peptidoglycan DD-metalloendopeptidase family protein [Candidatus Vicinibacter affinis]